MAIKSRKGKAKYQSKRQRHKLKSVKRRTKKVKTQKGGAATSSQKRSNRKKRIIVRFFRALGRIFRKRHVQYYSATQGNPAFPDPAVPEDPEIIQNHSKSVSPVFSGFDSQRTPLTTKQIEALKSLSSDKSSPEPTELTVTKAKVVSKMTPGKMRAVLIVEYQEDGSGSRTSITTRTLVLKYAIEPNLIENLTVESQNYKQLHLDYEAKNEGKNEGKKYNPEVIELYGAGQATAVSSGTLNYKFNLNFGEYANTENEAFFEMEFDQAGIKPDNYYLLLEYNPNYLTIAEIFKLLRQPDKEDLKPKVYSAVVQSVASLHENYDFVHADLKFDNVMVDVSSVLTPGASAAGGSIRVKNFDFDLSMFTTELLPFPEEGKHDTKRNPARHRPRYYRGCKTDGKPAVPSLLNRNDFWWPPIAMPLFDFKEGTIKIYDSYKVGNELTLPIKQLFLAFDLWRLYLGFGEGRTVATQVTFNYNETRYYLRSFSTIPDPDMEEFNGAEMDINRINQVRQELFK